MSTLITARLNETIQQDQNLIYCATVNLTWNELSNFVNGEITFKQYNETVDFLNRKSYNILNTFWKNKLEFGYATFYSVCFSLSWIVILEKKYFLGIVMLVISVLFSKIIYNYIFKK
jgi:hypothetical protein